MLLVAGLCAALATAAMLVVRYSQILAILPEAAAFPLQLALSVHIIATVVLLTAAHAMRRKRGVAIIFPRLLVCFLSLCFFGSVDLIVGVFYPPPVETNALHVHHIDRGWTNRPNAYGCNLHVWMRTDQNGMRIHEDLSDPDRPGQTRILFVGDSITLGYKLPARASYSWWTAKTLNDRHPRLDVAALNGGVCGYDTAQELDWMKEIGLSLESDLVVLQFCLNDVTVQFDPTLPPSRTRHIESVLAAPPNQWSGIQRAIFDIQMKMRYGSDLQQAAREIEHFRFKEVIGPNPSESIERAWTYMFEDLDRIRVMTADYEKPLLFVIFPIFDQLRNLDDPGRPQQKLCKYAESKGMHYLDLLPVYRHAIATGSTPNELFLDLTHPTELGHQIAAEAVADYIERHSLLAGLTTTTQSPHQTH